MHGTSPYVHCPRSPRRPVRHGSGLLHIIICSIGGSATLPLDETTATGISSYHACFTLEVSRYVVLVGCVHYAWGRHQMRAPVPDSAVARRPAGAGGQWPQQPATVLARRPPVRADVPTVYLRVRTSARRGGGAEPAS
jgi:hypothetical protein